MLGYEPPTNTLEFYQDAVKWRWLLPEEVFELIEKYEQLGCVVSTCAPECPPSGSIFMYDRRKCKRFRRDGHNWVTRKSAGRIREDHVKLMVGGVQRVAAAHAHSADSSAFHRRTYHLLNVDEQGNTIPLNENDDSMWLSVVHYRECEAKEDGSRKIRREQNEAAAKAAEEVKRVIATTNFDDFPFTVDQEDNALLVDAFTELFGGSDEAGSPGARTVDGAVDALTGQPVACWRLAPLRSPQQEQLEGNTSTSEISSLDSRDHNNKNKCFPPQTVHQIVSSEASSDGTGHTRPAAKPKPTTSKKSKINISTPSLQVKEEKYPFQKEFIRRPPIVIKDDLPTQTNLKAEGTSIHIIDVSPQSLFCCDAQDHKLLIVLGAPLQSMAPGQYTPGDRFGIRYLFDNLNPIDVEASVINNSTLRCEAPRRPGPCQAFLQLVLLRCQNQVIPFSPVSTQQNTLLRWINLPQQSVPQPPLPNLSPRTKSKIVFAQGTFPTHSVRNIGDNRNKRTIAQRSPLGSNQTSYFFVAPPPQSTFNDYQHGGGTKCNYINFHHGNNAWGPGPIIQNIPENSTSPASAMTATTNEISSRRSSSRSSWSSVNHLPSPAASDVLDDEKLASAPDAELDQYVERLVLKVLGQMSQVAATDSELADELNAPDSHGLCLLHYCALYNLSSVIHELVALGAHPDGRSGIAGLTPLHLAAGAGHVNVVIALIECGADIAAVDPNGKTAHDRAMERGQHKVGAVIDESPRALLKSDRKRARRDRHFFTTSQQQQQNEPLAAGDGEAMRLNKALLHTAFSSLSLHEKCALSMADKSAILNSPSSPHCECPETGAIVGKSSRIIQDTVQYDPESTATSAPTSLPPPVVHLQETDESMTDANQLPNNERHSIDVAMSLMGKSELSDLQDEARVITANARSWVVRRNYKKVRDAARLLEAKWIQRRSSRTGLTPVSENNTRATNVTQSSSDNNIEELSIDNHDVCVSEDSMVTSPSNEIKSSKGEPTSFVKTLQAHGRGMLERKKLSHIKEQICALLVISRNFRGKLSGLRRNSSSSVASAQEITQSDRADDHSFS
mmetsp:Transcript_4941/g.7440  ORF Transcript_4941/g.7440 Transcript_4941/m.7440 type:complete len:1070 (-) Transcript_4941:128-3337(-)